MASSTLFSARCLAPWQIFKIQWCSSVRPSIQKLWAFQKDKLVWKLLLWLEADPPDSGFRTSPLKSYCLSKFLMVKIESAFLPLPTDQPFRVHYSGKNHFSSNRMCALYFHQKCCLLISRLSVMCMSHNIRCKRLLSICFSVRVSQKTS